MLKKQLFKLLVGMSILTAPGVATAGGVATGHVTTFAVFNDNNFATVTLDTNRTSGAACGNPFPSSFSFQISSDVGKMWLSIINAAKLSGGLVTIIGTGTCSPLATPAGATQIESAYSVRAS